MHIVIVHELVLHVFTVKLYSCDLCEYKTKQKGDLKKRIEFLHGNAPHSCDQCDYKAKLKWGLKRHIRSAHKNLIFSCDQCKSTFQSDQGAGLENILGNTCIWAGMIQCVR